MREYGKIVPRFWTAGTGAQLRGNLVAQLAAAYLSTCPSASPLGIFYLPLVTMAHELGVTPEQAREALVDLKRVDFADYDEKDSMVWVPAMAKVSLGEKMSAGDKRLAWVRKELAQHAHHRFHGLFLAKYGASYGLSASAQAPPKDLPSPSEAARKVEEMEQEQEQEQDPSGGSAAPSAPTPPPMAKASSRRAGPKPPTLPGLEADRDPKPETPVEIGFRVFRAEWERVKRRPYVSGDRCGKAMVSLAKAAQRTCGELGKPEPGHLEQLFGHWTRAFLADPGRPSRPGAPGYLAETCHRLQDVEAGLAAYGTPWDRESAPQARPEPAIVAPARERGRARAAQVVVESPGPPDASGPQPNFAAAMSGAWRPP